MRNCAAGLCAKSNSGAAAPGTAPCGESGMTVIPQERFGGAAGRLCLV